MEICKPISISLQGKLRKNVVYLWLVDGTCIGMYCHLLPGFSPKRWIMNVCACVRMCVLAFVCRAPFSKSMIYICMHYTLVHVFLFTAWRMHLCTAIFEFRTFSAKNGVLVCVYKYAAWTTATFEQEMQYF